MIPFQILIGPANQLRGSDCGIFTPNVRFVPGRYAVGEISLIPVSEGGRGALVPPDLSAQQAVAED